MVQQTSDFNCDILDFILVHSDVRLLYVFSTYDQIKVNMKIWKNSILQWFKDKYTKHCFPIPFYSYCHYRVLFVEHNLYISLRQALSQ
jgi:hypothetical protein